MGVPNAGAVLVVDDNPALREAIARSLTRRGHRVTIAVDAVQGLGRLQGAVFDVVITDLQGRERGGLWLWRKALEARPELSGDLRQVRSESSSEIQPCTPATTWRSAFRFRSRASCCANKRCYSSRTTGTSGSSQAASSS